MVTTQETQCAVTPSFHLYLCTTLTTRSPLEVIGHLAEHIGDASGHAGGEVASGGPQDQHPATGHVLAAVVAHALRRREEELREKGSENRGLVGNGTIGSREGYSESR